MPAYDLPTPEVDHQQVEYWQTLYKQMHTLNARRYQHISTSKSIFTIFVNSSRRDES